MKLCSPQISVSPISNLGGTVYDREILKGLANLGAQVFMPLPRTEPYELVRGWRIYPTWTHWRYTYSYNLLFLPALLQCWRQTKFDLLRIHTPTLGPVGRLIQLYTGRPTVAHYHHVEADKRIHNAITRRVIHSYARITTDSHFCVEQLVHEFGVAREKLVIAYPGVDAKYQPLPNRADLRRAHGLQDKLVLLFMGVLTPRKNLHFLLDVFAQVRQQAPQARLLIAGRGPAEQALKAYATQLGVDKAVHFLGYVDEAQKVAAYNLADIFVLPSLMEGFGMVAAEAMACGVPAVTSNQASLPEVVGQAGLLASPTDVTSFSAQILRLVNDADLRAELGRAGQAHVRANFDWRRSAQTTLAAYKSI